MRSSLVGLARLLGLGLLAGCAQGQSSAPVASEITVVVGAGAKCAKLVKSIDLKVSPGSSEAMMLPGGDQLPFSQTVSLPASDGQVYKVEATFHLNTGRNGDQQELISVQVPSGSAGRVVLSFPCECIGTFCPENSQCTEAPRGSGRTQCEAIAECGNKICEASENNEFCPADCALACGNGTCDQGESCGTCPQDCGSCCGNGTCEATETCSLCAKDCGECAVCGDKICQSGEAGTCGDCTGACGDGTCDATEKQQGKCPADCGASCGNSVCEQGETCSSCAKDCGVCALCGNAVCDVGESCGSCPADCACSCGDGTCASGETCSNCAKDCGVCKDCGNGTCTSSASETCSSCPTDCGVTCGDSKCECGETGSSCSKDCPATCGNGKCDATETRTSCPLDCPAQCGDTLCEGGETAPLCPECGTGGAGGKAGAGGAAGKGGAGGSAGAGNAGGQAGSSGQGGQGGAAAGGVSGSSGQGGAAAGGVSGNSGQGGADCASQVEVCDGKDNNCNGKVDEQDPGGGVPCEVPGKLGPCKTGFTQCLQGKIECIPVVQASAEVCDGADNDCNGQVDDGDPGGGMSCEPPGSLGVCKTGFSQCVSGKVTCLAAVQPSAEICDNLDNDCDGSVDSGPLADKTGQSCQTGQPGVCSDGVWTCAQGQLTCVRLTEPTTDTCNGLDDNCDGQTDENEPGAGQDCTVGGVPANSPCASGKTACKSGSIGCVQTVQPSTEVCNGVDDDCSGAADDADPNVMCQLPGGNVASWSCSGSCQLVACAAAFANIDGNPTNGCECATDNNATSCGAAGQVSVPLGGSTVLSGIVDSAAGEDWFQVVFQTNPIGSIWQPRLSLGGAFASEYIFDVFEACGVPTSCNSGESGLGVAQWEQNFVYPLPGPGCCSDFTPRLTNYWVRVRRLNGDAPTCHPFSLTVSN